MATTKMIAHLINQKVLSEFLGLELLTLLLEVIFIKIFFKN
jgi:hypothetical protein